MARDATLDLQQDKTFGPTILRSQPVRMTGQEAPHEHRQASHPQSTLESSPYAAVKRNLEILGDEAKGEGCDIGRASPPSW